MTNPSLVAKSFNIPIKSLKRWLRFGPDRKKGKNLIIIYNIYTNFFNNIARNPDFS